MPGDGKANTRRYQGGNQPNAAEMETAKINTVIIVAPIVSISSDISHS
jgi:hypothetical protein